MSTKKYAPSVTLTPATANAIDNYMDTLEDNARYGKRSEVVNEGVALWLYRKRNSQRLEEALANIDSGSDQSDWYDSFRRHLDSD